MDYCKAKVEECGYSFPGPVALSVDEILRASARALSALD